MISKVFKVSKQLFKGMDELEMEEKIRDEYGLLDPYFFILSDYVYVELTFEDMKDENKTIH